MEFVALDVETANADRGSICAIGIAIFKHGVRQTGLYSLVDPKDEFDRRNIAIHGITPEQVAGSPCFADLHQEISDLLGRGYVVTHTTFDQTALHEASRRAKLPTPAPIWIDSAMVARRVWPQFSERGYGLANLTRFLGVRFEHHNALEDATAAGLVVSAALRETGSDLPGLLERSRRKIGASICGGAASSKKAPPPNPDGHLCAERIVFTGSLSVPRKDAAKLAARCGATVSNSVSKKTTIVVVGDQDLRRLCGSSKSTKHLRAEELQSAEQPIRIIGEAEFTRLTQEHASTG